MNSGTAILDFGVTPSQETSVVVPIQLEILPTSKVIIWFQADETLPLGEEYNSLEDHLLAGASVDLISSRPVSGSSFTIHATSRFGLWTGKFRVLWSWTL